MRTTLPKSSKMKQRQQRVRQLRSSETKKLTHGDECAYYEGKKSNPCHQLKKHARTQHHHGVKGLAESGNESG